MKRYVIPENMRYRKVDTGDVDELGRKIEVNVRISRKERRRIEKKITKDIDRQNYINQQRVYAIDMGIISRNRILEAIQNLHSEIRGKDITNSAVKYLRKIGIDPEIDENGDIVVNIKSITEKLSKTHIIDDETGEDMTETARKEVEQETEEAIANAKATAEMIRYPRIYNDKIATYVSFDKEQNIVIFEVDVDESGLKQAMNLPLNDWIALKLHKPVDDDVMEEVIAKFDEQQTEQQTDRDENDC